MYPQYFYVQGIKSMKLARRKRDIRISVSRKNEDIFVIWQAIQAADPNPSSTVIKWIRERYVKEWGKTKVLSPVQQNTTITKFVRPPKSEAEIKMEKERLEAERLAELERKRLKAEEIANIKRIMKSS